MAKRTRRRGIHRHRGTRGRSRLKRGAVVCERSKPAGIRKESCRRIYQWDGWVAGRGSTSEGVVHRKGYVVASCIMSDSDYQLSLGAGEGQKVLRWRLDVLVVFFYVPRSGNSNHLSPTYVSSVNKAGSGEVMDTRRTSSLC